MKFFLKQFPQNFNPIWLYKTCNRCITRGEGAEIIKSSNCGIVEEKADYLALANNIRSMLKLTKEKK